MKRGIVRIVITILIIVIGMIALLRWITWGFPWETMKVSRFAQEYVDTHYDEPIKVVGSKRFLRENGYDTVVQMLNYPEIRFTISWDLDLKFIRDDSKERIIEYKLDQQIRNIIEEISSHYTVQVIISSLNINGEVAIDMPLEEIDVLLDERYTIVLRTNKSMTAKNYADFLPEIYAIIYEISQLEYNAHRISIYTNESDFRKGYENFNVPSLNIAFSKSRYLSIKSPEDIIPYIENAIEDNPYYGN